MGFDPNSHVDELIGVYALDALSADERRTVERHLRVCSRCRALANEALSSVELVALSADPIAPSPELKDRLLARIDADLALSRSRQQPFAALFATRARTFAFAVTLAVMVGLFVFGLSLRTFNLPAQSAPPGAQAQLIAIPSLPTGLLRVSGLTKLGAEQTYEVWLIRNGNPESALMFNVDPEGKVDLWVNYDEPIGNIEQMGITIERAGGSSTPNLNAFVFYGALH